jgi:hypothetical protein
VQTVHAARRVVQEVPPEASHMEVLMKFGQFIYEHALSLGIVTELLFAAQAYDRGTEYVLQQCNNLQLNGNGLPLLFELCDKDSHRTFKALLAYEYGIVDRSEFKDVVLSADEAAVHAWEFMVNDLIERDRELAASGVYACDKIGI